MWTAVEDRKLLRALEHHGLKKWGKVAGDIGTKNVDDVKNRFTSCYPQRPTHCIINGELADSPGVKNLGDGMTILKALWIYRLRTNKEIAKNTQILYNLPPSWSDESMNEYIKEKKFIGGNSNVVQLNICFILAIQGDLFEYIVPVANFEN